MTPTDKKTLLDHLLCRKHPLLAVEAEKQETKVSTQQTDEGSMRREEKEREEGGKESRRKRGRDRGERKGEGDMYILLCCLSRFAMPESSRSPLQLIPTTILPVGSM